MSNPAPAAKVANPVQAALAAFTAGKDPMAAVYGSSSETSATKTPAPKPEAPEASVQAESQASAPQDEVETQSETPVANEQEALPDSEEIVVTDDAGRRKLKVDYKDRVKIKKAFELAAGFRKHQAERDRAIARAKELETIVPEHTDLKKTMSALEQAFDKDGVAGIVNLLAKKPGSYEAFIEAEIARRDRKANASPAELKQIELEERLERSERERAAKDKEVQEYLEKGKTERELAEKRSAEAVLHPTFNKYRFAGTLGDEALEGRLDSAIWEQSRAELSKLPDDVEITPAMVDKTFREIAGSFRKAIKGQAEKVTNQTLAARKVNASEAAAAAATKSTPRTSQTARDGLVANMKKGSLKDSIMDALTGKVNFR